MFSPPSPFFDQLPASWAIPASGRGDSGSGTGAVKPAAVGDDEEEEGEDAVCQVCFDGESVEANPIVFCDSCNIAIHKAWLL